MLSFFIQGSALGITAAASPGPLQTFLIQRTLDDGWRRGAVVAFAPLISDAPIVLVIILLLERLPQGYLRWISLTGGIFVLYLAWGAWQNWRSPSIQTQNPENVKDTSLRKAVMMNILSPGPYTFWTLVNGPLLISAMSQSVFHGVSFLLGFYGVFICGMLGMVAIFHQARRLGARAVRWLTLLSIIILLAFGLILIGQALFPQNLLY